MSAAGFEPATHALKGSSTQLQTITCTSSLLHARRNKINEMPTRHRSGCPEGARNPASRTMSLRFAGSFVTTECLRFPSTRQCTASPCRTIVLCRLSTAKTNGAVRHNSNTRLGSVRLKRSFRARRGSLQLFKPRTHVLTLSTCSRITVFTVWAVDFQDGQQEATPTSQVPPSSGEGRFKRLAEQKR